MNHVSLIFLLLTSLIMSACSTQQTVESTTAEVAKAETVTPEPEQEDVEPPTRPFPDDAFHDLLIAEFAVRRNQFDTALGNYIKQAFKTQDKGVAQRATRLARFMQAEKAALDGALLWAELEPDSLEANFTAAIQLAKAQRPMQAIPLMAKVLEGQGEVNFVFIAASAGNQPEAIREHLLKELDQLQINYPDETQIKTAKAILLQSLNQPEKALVLTREVLATQPEDFQAILIQSKLLLQLDQTDASIQLLEETLNKHPDNRRLRLHYARVLTRTDLNKAKQQFEILYAAKPKDGDLLFSLALINKELNDVSTAKQYLEQLISMNHRQDDAQYYLGNIAEDEKLWSEAIAHYQKIPPGKNFLPALTRIIDVYKNQGLIETARQELRQLRQKHPDEALKLFLIEGDLLLDSRQYLSGYQLMSDALHQSPDNIDLLYSRSLFSEKLQNIDDVETDLRAILEQQPDNPVALNALGYMLSNHSSRYAEALNLISKAYAIKPNDPAILDSLGWVNFRLGNLEEAHALLQKALAMYPDHEVAAHLGEVLWQMNKKPAARNIWREALQRKPDSEILQETVERLTGSTDLP